jgi:hypothetical protein
MIATTTFSKFIWMEIYFEDDLFIRENKGYFLSIGESISSLYNLYLSIFEYINTF